MMQSAQHPEPILRYNLPVLTLPIDGQPLRMIHQHCPSQMEVLPVDEKQEQSKQESQGSAMNDMMEIQQQQQQKQTQLHPPKMVTASDPLEKQYSRAFNLQPRCIRQGCNNPAIQHEDWHDEYCSQWCVIQHCRAIFSNFQKDNLLKLDPPVHQESADLSSGGQ